MWFNAIEVWRELSERCPNFTRKGEFQDRWWTAAPVAGA
jgi:hypothetical protein